MMTTSCSFLSYEELLREKDEKIQRLEAELGARSLTDMPFNLTPTAPASTAMPIQGAENVSEELQISHVKSRKRSPKFIEESFDAETNQRVKKPRIGQGRQGKLTKEGLETLKQVKKAGGQCIRCKVLKKKVRDDFVVSFISWNFDSEEGFSCFSDCKERDRLIIFISSQPL